jgi:hypothetical protein
MRISRNTQQHATPASVEITKAQAIGLIEAVVLCFGIQSFSITGVLAHRSIYSFGDIAEFMPDELNAGVKVALSMAVKLPLTDVIPGALYHQVSQIFGKVHGPIWFKIDNGSYHLFDPNAPL